MRAHLVCDLALKTAFQDTDKPWRVLQIKIENETMLLAQPPIPPKGKEEQDFQALVLEGILEGGGGADQLCGAAPPPAAALLIFALDDATRVLIKYISGSAKVREKLLFSSCVKDLKEGLGATNNLRLFEAHDKEDVSFAAILEALGKSGTTKTAADLPLTHLERLALEERHMEKDRTVRLPGMAQLSFAVEEEVKTALQTLLTQQGGGPTTTNWLELKVEDEKVKVVSTRAVPAETMVPDGSFSALLPTDEPRFLVVAHQQQQIFFYYCPSGAPPKKKMLYSSCKRTAFSILRKEVEADGAAAIVEKEIQDPSDIGEVLSSSAVSGDGPSGDSGASAAVVAELQHALLNHSRPRGPPGRAGARRVFPPTKKEEGEYDG